MRKVVFEFSAFEDFNNWIQQDKKLHKKIIELIRDINRSPFAGLGKPESLKHEFSGYWSRRISDEHRLVYKVTETEIIVISCRYHYE
jgi:toxin YoeB